MELNEKYKKFDAADYLKNLDDVTTRLEGALEDSAVDPNAAPLKVTNALGLRFEVHTVA